MLVCKKEGFFARIFELYCQLIISGENEGRERTFTEEEEKSWRVRERSNTKRNPVRVGPPGP